MAKTPFGLLCFGKGSRPRPMPCASPPSESKITGPLLPELHINIWERDTSVWYTRTKIQAFLDIGLMLDIQEQSTSIEILVPWRTKNEDIIDLSSHITKLDAIYAIFNESWTLINGHGGWIVEDTSGSHEPFAIVAARPGTSIKCSQYPTSDGDRFGVTVDVQSLINQATQASSSAGGKAIRKLYVRFRLMNVDRGAYCVGEKDKTKWWVPSWQRTDVIDFRVNVRRGAPTNIENEVDGWFMDFAKIQLFMMRDRSQDIVYEDKLFKACRSLEDEEFWANYSSGSIEGSTDAVRSNVKRSMGYQWKDGGGGKPVREFGIAARFKIVEFGIGKYLLVALLIGAIGSALWDFFKVFVWDPLPTSPTVQAVCVNAQEIVNQANQRCVSNGKKEPLVQRKGS